MYCIHSSLILLSCHHLHSRCPYIMYYKGKITSICGRLILCHWPLTLFSWQWLSANDEAKMRPFPLSFKTNLTFQAQSSLWSETIEDQHSCCGRNRWLGLLLFFVCLAAAFSRFIKVTDSTVILFKLLRDLLFSLPGGNMCNPSPFCYTQIKHQAEVNVNKLLIIITSIFWP